MKTGDLVIRRGHFGFEKNRPYDVGIVIEVNPRWPDARDEELLASVLYPSTGDEVEWSEHALEVVNENR